MIWKNLNENVKIARMCTRAKFYEFKFVAYLLLTFKTISRNLITKYVSVYLSNEGLKTKKYLTSSVTYIKQCAVKK